MVGECVSKDFACSLEKQGLKNVHKTIYIPTKNKIEDDLIYLFIKLHMYIILGPTQHRVTLKTEMVYYV